MTSLFFKPDEAWAADFIPFHANGSFQLFYLKDWRNHAEFGEGTPWALVETDDLTSFTDHGEVLPRGSVEEQDLYVFTGSVIEAEGCYHIFYTGHNPHYPAKGKPMQAIMHAVSDDLRNWRKLPEHTFFAPADRYEPDDWRDPFVFWNEEAGEYWMLICARLKQGPSRRRGCVALCASKDLAAWEEREPFWTPHLYYTMECPDLFRIGEWWYMVYSTFSERHTTHYRMSRSLAGLWLAPDNDSIDGRAFYAGKTATDGAHRYIFGWNATRSDESDEGRWNWGGSLVVHEVVQQEDGTLTVNVPEQVERSYMQPLSYSLEEGIGRSSAEGDRVKLEGGDGFACAIGRSLPQACRLSMMVSFKEGTRGFGVMLNVDEQLEEAYYIRIEPDRRRLVFDRWPRPGDVPHMVELERPLAISPGQTVELTILIENTLCEIYVDRQVAMSARMYSRPGDGWGVFASEGAAEFQALTMNTAVLQ